MKLTLVRKMQIYAWLYLLAAIAAAGAAMLSCFALGHGLRRAVHDQAEVPMAFYAITAVLCMSGAFSLIRKECDMWVAVKITKARLEQHNAQNR